MSRKGSSKGSKHLESIQEAEPGAVGEKQGHTLSNDNHGDGSTALGTIQPHADPDLNASLTNQHTTLEHADLNPLSETKKSPNLAHPMPAHETIQEDERESEYASTAPKGKMKVVHVGMSSVMNHNVQAAASGKTASHITLTNQSHADDTSQKEATDTHQQ